MPSLLSTPPQLSPVLSKSPDNPASWEPAYVQTGYAASILPPAAQKSCGPPSCTWTLPGLPERTAYLSSSCPHLQCTDYPQIKNADSAGFPRPSRFLPGIFPSDFYKSRFHQFFHNKFSFALPHIPTPVSHRPHP